MKIEHLNVRAPFLLLKKEMFENETKGGFILEENTDDFLVVGEVVKAFEGAEFSVGCMLIFHILNAESLRDAGQEFYLLDVKHVRGTYGEPVTIE